VRSIQLHDDDVDQAGPGDRAGLALKGIEAEEIERGMVLTADPAVTSAGTLTGRASIIPYWPDQLREGMVLSVGHWMQFIPARIAFVDNSGDWRRPNLTLRTEKDLIFLPATLRSSITSRVETPHRGHVLPLVTPVPERSDAATWG